MHSAINIREIVRNSIDGGGVSGSSPLRYDVGDFNSSSGGGSSIAANEGGPHLTPSGTPKAAGPILQSSGKGKRKRSAHEDPMSHRIIEKRRRDRMNNCLADLSRLIPSSYSKKERGRIEKTEIIEMAIRHLKNIQTHCTCGIFESPEIERSETSSMAYNEETSSAAALDSKVSCFKMGYDECTAEVVNFLVESEGFYVGDSICVRLTRHLGHSFGVKHKGGALGKRHSSTQSLTASTTSNVTSSSSSDTGSYGRSHKYNEPSSEHYMHHYIPEGDKYLKGGGGHSHPLSASGFPHANMGNTSRASWSQHLKSSQYKFKSNLHERFSSHQKPYSNSDSSMKYCRKSEQLSPLDYSQCWTPLHHQSRPGEESLFRPYSHIETSAKLDASPATIPRSNVPIFALHPKEGYYMALSVDSALIDPYLILFTQIDKVSLHPITISVNFCGPMALAFASYNSNSSAPPTTGPQPEVKNDSEFTKKNNSDTN